MVVVIVAALVLAGATPALNTGAASVRIDKDDVGVRALRAHQDPRFDGFPTYGNAIDCTPSRWVTPDRQVFDQRPFRLETICQVDDAGGLKDCRIGSGAGYGQTALARIGACVASYLHAKPGGVDRTVRFEVQQKPATGPQPYLLYPSNPDR